jgi:uroporphyrinogen III methyltransferase/synthase
MKLENYSNILAICIGEQTGREAAKYSMQIRIAKRAAIDSMVDLIEQELKE